MCKISFEHKRENICLKKESSWKGLDSLNMCTEWQQNTTKSTNEDVKLSFIWYANFSDIYNNNKYQISYQVSNKEWSNT
jgi:hypothetical protein